MEVKPPKLPTHSTIEYINNGVIRPQSPIPMPAHAIENFQIKVGTFCLRVLRKPLILLLSIGAKRREATEASRDRQSALRFFWWTRNMTAAEIIDFSKNHGGLLSGNSFDKQPREIRMALSTESYWRNYQPK